MRRRKKKLFYTSKEKSCKFLERILQKKTPDLLNRHFLLEKRTNQKFHARIFQQFAFLAHFARFLLISARLLHYLARSCKELPRILQILSDRITRVISRLNVVDQFLLWMKVTETKLSDVEKSFIYAFWSKTGLLFTKLGNSISHMNLACFEIFVKLSL